MVGKDGFLMELQIDLQSNGINIDKFYKVAWNEYLFQWCRMYSPMHKYWIYKWQHLHNEKWTKTLSPMKVRIWRENSFVELQAFWKKSISGHNEPTSMARQGWKCQEYSGPKIVLSLR